MSDDTGPDPLTPAQRILILRDHLEREKSRRREAEAKLAAIRSVLLEGGQEDATARRRALAIIGTEEDNVPGGSYDVWGADFGVEGGKA